jgi:DNA-binding NarL/FixJ family response regulator
VIDVLLVDDEAMVREGFRMILETEPDIRVAGEAADGREALRQTAELHPDVVLMDIRMPELDGLEATRRVLLASPETRVLMLTTFGEDGFVWQAMNAGASGFLLKDVPPEDLVSAVRTIHRGESLLAPSITRRLIQEFARRPQPGAVPEEAADLTEREREVLRLMARGLANAEIARRLVLGETTVKTHVTRILAKLGVRDRVQAVVFAYETGLVTPGEN